MRVRDLLGHLAGEMRRRGTNTEDGQAREMGQQTEFEIHNHLIGFFPLSIDGPAS